MSEFKLEPFVQLPSAQLPGGFKQLAMATALLHRPEILFLDEPTSGADSFARREFWQRITALAATGRLPTEGRGRARRYGDLTAPPREFV